MNNLLQVKEKSAPTKKADERQLEPKELNLIKILEESADSFYEKPAFTMKIDFRSKTFSYNDVLKLARKFAFYLELQNITSEDKVIICAPNSPYWICSFWGCLIKQVIVVPLDIQSSKEMIESVIKETGAKLLIKHRFFRHELTETIDYFQIEHFEEILKEADKADFKPEEVSADQVVQILYTSGTTGKPKGTVLTHRNLSANVKSVEQIIKLPFENEKMLSLLPLSHIYEQNVGFLFPFKKGVQIIYVHSFTEIRSLMKKHQITIMIAVPEFLQLLMSRIESKLESNNLRYFFDKLLQLSAKVNSKTFSRFLFFPVRLNLGGKLNTIASGGSPLDPELEKKWMALGVDVLQGYGLTETSPVVTMNSHKEKKTGSAGKVVPGVEVKIEEDKEILVKGSNVFKEYYNEEEKTNEAFTEDGWFKTGDLGEFDKEGFLFLKGRKKYMILGPGGQNVYPEDIEKVLNNFSDVKDSSVLGIESSSGKVKIHAVLLLDSSKEKEEADKIVSQANDKLASYQKINDFTVWPEEDFPRTVTRKIKKEEVRKFVEEGETASQKQSKEKKGKLVKILSKLSGIAPEKINSETKVIDDLNLDSLTRVELLVWIEEDFGIAIPESELTTKTTVADLDDLVKKRKPVPEPLKLRKWTRSKWVLPIKWVGFVFFQMIGKLFIDLKVKGRDNLKDLPLPAIFMGNHISSLDSLAIYMALPKNIRKNISFAAARDVLYDEYKGWSLFIEITFNSFPIQRGEQQNIRKGLEFMGEMLDNGYSVVVHPEGRMSKTGELQDLKKGAGVVATEMEAWVVPLKIKGTNHIVPFEKVLPRKRGKVEIIFGKPMKFKKTDDDKEVIKLIKKALED